MSGDQPFKIVTIEGIEYVIRSQEMTADLIRCQSNKQEIIIPPFKNTNVESVKFEPNSELQVIWTEAFSNSKLTSIVIPSHVTQICESAFSRCQQLTRVLFEPNSELKIIEKYAFAFSNLSSILIPAGVKKICEGTFIACNHLSSIDFEPNSECQAIEKRACSSFKLTSLRIPASLVELDDEWCVSAKKLSHVEVEPGNAMYTSVGGKCIIGKSDILNKEYDTLVFWTPESVEAKIPKTIKIIGMHAFLRSNIGSILIPAHVKRICEGAFSGCRQLSRVEIEPNSELQTIEKEAFKGTCLANIRIPASTVELKDGWCIGAFKLNQVEVENGNARYLSIGGKIIIGKSDLENNDYDNFVFCTRGTVNVKIQKTIKTIRAYAFSCSKLKRILIPAHITQIGRSAFSECRQLTRVDIEPNSKLKTIEEHVFSETKIFKILIPAHVTQICKGAFF